MTKRIFRSLLFTAIAVLIVSMVVIGSVLYSYLGDMQRDALAEQAGIAAAEYEKNGEAYLTAFSSNTYRITLVLSDGTVAFDSVSDAAAMENHLHREEVQEALAAGTGDSERYSATLLEKTYYNARRLSNGSVLRVSHTKSSIYTLLLGLLQPTAAVLILAFLLSLLLSNRLSNRIVRPLESLDLENPLENDTYDELSAVLSKIAHQQNALSERERELTQKNDEFSAVTENMTEGLILLGTDSEILSINRAAREIFRAERDCIGKNLVTLNRTPEFSAVAEQCIGGKPADCSLSLYAREYRITANPVLVDEKIRGACLLIFDITEKSRNEHIRKEFTANVSHELKTPLHSIMGASELLKSGLVKPGDEKQFAGRIYTEAARLVTLVEDIIRLSQLDEGVIAESESVNLTEIAKEAVDSVKEEAAARSITVSVCGEDVLINGVKRLVYEIAYNLCDNAVRYNRENGSVCVTVEGTPSGALLTVTDSGIGIPEDSLERIFERFYRVDKSHARETGGTGLGLSIVKHAAEYLGARIAVKSKPGEGTEISVLFCE